MGVPSEGLAEMSYRNSGVGKGLSGTAEVNWYLEEGTRMCKGTGWYLGQSLWQEGSWRLDNEW